MVRGQPQALGEGGAGVSQPPASLTGESRRSPNVKIFLFSFVLLSLLGVLTLAAVREVVTSPANSRTAHPTLAPARPPLTPAEEAYALALWPIHNEVKASALKMTLGGLAYKLGELDRAGLKSKVDASSETLWRRDGFELGGKRASVLAYDVSPSGCTDELTALHEETGGSDHFIDVARLEAGVGQRLSMEASEKLLKVGDVLWPSEYRPN